MVSIATLNVNGLRAAARKGMPQWLEKRQTGLAPLDVLLLQEVRAEEAVAEKTFQQILRDAHQDPQEWSFAVYPCQLKGRAGVAIAARGELKDLSFGLPTVSGGEDQPVDSGRWIEAQVELDKQVLRVVSFYAHSGEVGTEKMAQKYAHLQIVDKRMEQLLTYSQTNQQLVVVGGDYNVVRGPLDIKNYRPNHNKTAGVLDEEMAHLETWFGQQGWRDVVRDLHGDAPGPYSWWSFRGRAFDNDAGWRIDYLAVSPQQAGQFQHYAVDRAAEHETRFSDHAPVVIF